MNQNLQLLLQKHFNWSLGFSLNLNWPPKTENLMESYLLKIEQDLNLKPYQLMHLIDENKLEMLFVFINACFENCHHLSSQIDKTLEKKLNQSILELIPYGFSHKQLLELNPEVYVSDLGLHEMYKKLKYVTSIYQKSTANTLAYHPETLFNSPNTSATIASMESIDSRDLNIDDETLEVLSELLLEPSLNIK